MANTEKKSVAPQPTLGEKLVEFFPSHHRDPERKSEQERGLRDLVDFIVPQSKTDLALEAALIGVPALKPLRKAIKKWGKSEKQVILDAFEDGQEWVADWWNMRMRGGNFQGIVDPSVTQKRASILKNKDVTTEHHIYDPNTPREPLASYKDSNVISRENDKGVVSSLRHIDNDERGYFRLNNRFEHAQFAEAWGKKFNMDPLRFMKSLGVHESTHYLTRGDRLMRGPIADYIKRQQVDSQGIYNAFKPQHYSLTTKTWLPLDRGYVDYLRKPTETFARVMQIRYELGLNPKDFNNVLDESALWMTNDPYTELRAIYKHDQIQDMVNKLPAVAALPLADMDKKKDASSD